MSVSTNSVVHYTSKYVTLKSILKSQSFNVSYCLEEFENGENRLYQAVAMVSFCDIPFSHALQHMNSYGSYAIGLSKSWADKKGLNPVLYVGKKTPVNSGIIFQNETAIDLAEKLDENLGPISKILASITCYMCFIKHHTDDLQRNGHVVKKYSFYNEREWRYVPLNTYNECWIGFSPDDDLAKRKQKKQAKNKELRTKDIKLSFDIEDITYIILKNNKTIPNFLAFCKKNMTPGEVMMLATKITTVERIKSDF